MCKFLYLLVLLLPVVCDATADNYHLVRILVRGSRRYSEAELVRATGLSLNSRVSADDLKNVANRLGGSGAFSSVQYLFKPAIGTDGIEADFDLTDAPQFLPALFDNFVWFSPDELQTSLRNALPLYNGALPTSGSLPEDVIAALGKLLASKNLPSQVSYMMQGEMGKPPKAFLYKVENANLKVGEINFSGANHLEPNLAKQTTAPLKSTEYLYSTSESFLRFRIGDLYLQRGFLKAALTEIKPKAAQNGAVDLDVTVNEGEQYKLASYTWTGNNSINSDELSRHLHLKTGEPVNALKLREDLEEDRKLFGKFGREAATISPVPQFNGSEVAYTFQVAEGDLYRMGKLEVVAPEDQRQKILSAWKLQEGAPYDNTYIKQLVLQLKPAGAGKLEWIAHEQIDDAMKTVNVRLEFKVTR